MYDVIIVGGGICGCAIAYELSQYNIKTMVIEKENDVSMGTTKANSGIVHAGYDPKSGTLMAKYNVQGASLIKQMCSDLDVMYRQTGSFVLAFDDDEVETLNVLYKRGIENGVKDLSVISGAQALALEPQLNKSVKAALYAKTTAVITPWEFCIALAEVASKNGVLFKLSTEVTGIARCGDGFTVSTNDGNECDFDARFVINAAGLYSDKVAGMVAPPDFAITPSKGEYFLLDHSQATKTSRVIFQCPNKNGKGVLVAPTAYYNLIVGPNTTECEVFDVSTSTAGLNAVRLASARSIPDISFDENIRNFAGVRSNSTADDFIVEINDCFVNVAGIKSPGLSSAPAIAKDVVTMLSESGLKLSKNPNSIKTRKVVRFNDARTADEKDLLIAQNPLYGRVICRCETITEAEIVNAIHSCPSPRSIDAIKRRCGSGMGRCQGGFCGPRVHEILARELGIPMTEILLDKSGTFILTGETKTREGDE